MEISIYEQKNESPKGYLCLGLSYKLDNEKRILFLEKMILVKVDLYLPLYYDMFECDVDNITEKDGRHYYQGCPILNYDMLETPSQLDEVEEKHDRFGCKEGWVYINTKGRTKYSVNRVCNIPPTSFCDKYTELYACAIDFDEMTLQGSVIGFDCLGKLVLEDFDLDGLTDNHDIRKALLNEMVLFDLEESRNEIVAKEIEARKAECGILNFDYCINENGDTTYHYEPIMWE